MDFYSLWFPSQFEVVIFSLFWLAQTLLSWGKLTYFFPPGKYDTSCPIKVGNPCQSGIFVRWSIIYPMDEWTIKTPNPICRLFFKIDLFTDFSCCPHRRRNYNCVLLPLYLLSDLPPFLNKMSSIYRQCVALRVWGWEGVELWCRPCSAGVLHSVSDQIQNLQNCYTIPNKNDQ